MIQASPILGREIVIYGAGNDALTVILPKLRRLKINVAFCVANTNVGQALCFDNNATIRVESPDILVKDKHFVIVASSLYYEEMTKTLRELGYFPKSDYFVWNIWDEANNEENLQYFAKQSPLDEKELSRVYYLSCLYLHKDIDIFSTKSDGLHLRFCCRGNGFNAKTEIPDVAWEGDDDQAIDKLLQLKHDVIEAYRMGTPVEHDFCKGCTLLRRDVWDVMKQEFEWSSFGLYPTPCNFRCSYCTIPDEEKTSCDIVAYKAAARILANIEKRGLVPAYAVHTLSSGEISASPGKEILYKAIEKYVNNFVTNASIYDEFIARKLTDGKSKIITSIDSGTRETFLKIRGVDLFDKVVENLRKYADCGCVELKYILLKGKNDNDEDYDGVINICKQLGLNRLSVSVDLNLNNDFDKYPLDELARFIQKLYANGISVFNLTNSLPIKYYKELLQILPKEVAL